MPEILPLKNHSQCRLSVIHILNCTQMVVPTEYKHGINLCRATSSVSCSLLQISDFSLGK